MYMYIHVHRDHVLPTVLDAPHHQLVYLHCYFPSFK